MLARTPVQPSGSKPSYSHLHVRLSCDRLRGKMCLPSSASFITHLTNSYGHLLHGRLWAGGRNRNLQTSDVTSGLVSFHGDHKVPRGQQHSESTGDKNSPVSLLGMALSLSFKFSENLF